MRAVVLEFCLARFRKVDGGRSSPNAKRRLSRASNAPLLKAQTHHHRPRIAATKDTTIPRDLQYTLHHLQLLVVILFNPFRSWPVLLAPIRWCQAVDAHHGRLIHNRCPEGLYVMKPASKS
jgi:hypothetical protein